MKKILFLLLLLPLTVHASQSVAVSTYVLNFGKFDVSTGSYTVDFYLDFKCAENCSPENFEFMNGRATSIDKLIDTPTEKFYRIQASLSQNIDLKQYPFDTHQLTIELEDTRNTIDEIVYVPDNSESGVDPSVIIVGWDLGNWSSSVTEHYYAPYNETYSRYSFALEINRVSMTSIIKSFLPVIFMVIISLLSLLLTADKVTTRLGINTSTLIAAVMFHVNLSSSIPPVGYLTFADKFMMATYVIMMAILASGVLLMMHTDSNDKVAADRIHNAALYYMPVLTVVVYAAIFIFG